MRRRYRLDGSDGDDVEFTDNLLTTPEIESLIDDLSAEIDSRAVWLFSERSSAALRAILDFDPAFTTLMATRLVERSTDASLESRYHPNFNALAKRLCRFRRPWSEARLIRILGAMEFNQRQNSGMPIDTPAASIVRVIDQTYAGEVPKPVAVALESLADACVNPSTHGVPTGGREFARNVSKTLSRSPRTRVLGDDPWSQRIEEVSEPAAVTASGLLLVCSTARSNLRPKRFERELSSMAGDDAQHTAELAAAMLTAAIAVPIDTEIGVVPPEIGDVLRGLAWTIELANLDGAAECLGRAAAYGWSSVPHHGAVCKRLANAAVASLSRIDGSREALELALSHTNSNEGRKRILEVLSLQLQGLAFGLRGYPVSIKDLRP